jgi:hypothetical protein
MSTVQSAVDTQVDRFEQQITAPDASVAPVKRPLRGIDIAGLAKEQMLALTGLSASTVSGLSKDAQGWHVMVDMVELKRIPASSDVLANYDVLLDGEGNLLSYKRTRRYYRGTAEDES